MILHHSNLKRRIPSPQPNLSQLVATPSRKRCGPHRPDGVQCEPAIIPISLAGSVASGVCDPTQWGCQMAEVPPPAEEILLTHFIVSDDVERSGASTPKYWGARWPSEEPTQDRSMSNYPTAGSSSMSAEARPTTSLRHLETPRDPDRVSSFLNIRVKDIEAVYAEWRARGAHFLTPPKQHQYEIRCYIRDPDGHLIEVGQTTDPGGLVTRSLALEYVRRELE